MKTFRLLLVLLLSVLSFEMYGQVNCDIDDIKFIRVNVHFMLREPPLTPRNFTECDNGKGDDTFTGYDYAQSLIQKSNDNWSKNYLVNLYPGDTPPSYEVPKKVQLVLTGVYYHRDDNLYDAFPIQNDPTMPPPPPASEIGETYGVDMDNTLNIFMMEKGPFLNPGGGFNRGGVVVSSFGFPVILLRNAWFSYPTNSGSDCIPCDQWITSNSRIYGTARGFNHELGHIFGLCHSFGGANPCAENDNPSGFPPDIDPFQECNDTDDNDLPITGSCTSGGCHNFESGSNNLMGYNGLAHSLTPCQIQIMNENILADFSDYIEMCCSEYTFKDIECPDCAPNPDGDTGLPLPGQFTTPGCEPDGFAICLPVNCPATPPNLLFPEVDFNFAHENTNPDETFSICEDVWLSGNISPTYLGYHVQIQDVVGGEGVYPVLAQTAFWENDQDPSWLNITELFENDNIQFIPGNTYEVRLGVKYDHDCVIFVDHQFTYAEEVLEFQLEHENGTPDEFFSLCEDIWIEGNINFPYIGYHVQIQDVVGGEGVYPVLAQTAFWENDQDPSWLNITELFENDNIQFIPGNTYEVRLGIKYNDNCIVYADQQFTYVEEVLEFQLMHGDGTPDEFFNQCEDVWLAGDILYPYIGYHVLIQDFVGNAGVWPELAQTNYWETEGDPSWLNITELFENNNIQFIIGNQYQVRLGIKYNDGCIVYAYQQYTVVENEIDLDLEHINGIPDNEFTNCEDVFLDGGGNPVADQHSWTLWANGNPIAQSNQFPPGELPLPTLANVFSNVVFQLGILYTVQLEIYNADCGDEGMVVQKDFTFIPGIDLAAGRIRHWCEGMIPVDEVTVVVDGLPNQCISITQEDGLYDCSGTSNYTIVPGKNINILEGVDNQDLQVLSNYLLGTGDLNPFQKVAADINNDQQITQVDYNILEFVIAQGGGTFPNNTSWRFHDALEPLPAVGQFPVLKEFISFEEGCRDNMDFFGIKIGDLICSPFRPNPTDGGRANVDNNPETGGVIREPGNPDLRNKQPSEKDWIKLYPNPVTDNLFFETNKTLEGISIYNTNSQIVKHLKKTGLENGVIDIDFLPDGVYFIRFTNSDHEVEIQKIVKIK